MTGKNESQVHQLLRMRAAADRMMADLRILNKARREAKRNVARMKRTMGHVDESARVVIEMLRTSAGDVLTDYPAIGTHVKMLEGLLEDMRALRLSMTG